MHYPLIIVGAGAAGLGASGRASEAGIEHVVLEASHRTGGRGLTETLDNGVPVDLGCHWMHSASRNPMVAMADQLGFTYLKANPVPAVFSEQRWQPDSYIRSRQMEGEAINSRIEAAYKSSSGKSIWDCIEPDNVHTPWFTYWYGLMHSNDPDQVDTADVMEYVDTDEDWPVRDGYGALISLAGFRAPVQLNTPVRSLDWAKDQIVVGTPSGELTADRLLITVSTGVLGAGDIEFYPSLPSWKNEAVAALPLGNYNNLIFALTPGALLDAPAAVTWENGEQCVYLKIRPYGRDMLFTSVAGRFGWWLEKQGENASREWLSSILVDLFGSQVTDELGQFKASAWGFDPWVRGAYSSLLPGRGAMRKVLATPVNDRLFFAGEATSTDAFNTAHGAWLSGEAAVTRIADSLTQT